MAELPASKPARRPRRWAWPVAGILAAGAVSAVAFVALRDDEPATTKVTFEVIGSSTTLRSILWRTPDGDTTDPVSSGTLPWSKTVEITAVEGVLYVNALAYTKGVADPHGSLSCRITVDGLVIEQDGPNSTGTRCWTTVQRALKAKAEQH